MLRLFVATVLLARVHGQVKLPIFTTSDSLIRPSKTEDVIATTGSNELKHSLKCAKKAQWAAWPNKDNKTEEEVVVGCNYDQSIIGEGIVMADANSCATKVADQTGTSYLDPQCYLQGEGVTLQHRWGNYEKSIRELRDKNPSDVNVTTEDLYVLMPTLDPGFGTGILSISQKFLVHMLWNPKSMDPGKKPPYDCKDGCKYGSNIKVKYEKSEKAMHVFLQSFCDWFTVCTDWKNNGCAWGATVNVMLRNGFVAFDSRKEQVPMRLIRRSDDNGIVRVDLTILGKDTIGKGTKYAHMAVTSMFRQRVLGPVTPGDHMMFTFSQPNCLHPKMGLRAQSREVNVVILQTDDGTYQTEVETANHGNVATNYETPKSVATGEQVPEATTTVDPKKTTEVEVTAAATTTPTNAPLLNANQPLISNIAEQFARYEGHATWAIFYGWLLGSALAMLVMVPVMYFMRRSIYNDWYRGVYKRYGCDVSGTTGGVTGEDFGNTTIQESQMTSVMTTTSVASTAGTTDGGTTTSATSKTSSVNGKSPAGKNHTVTM